jgi:hypothetical protein
MPSDEWFNEEDRHIRTISGMKFYLAGAPADPSGICLKDICHALSHIGRFTGQTKRFYSVAEHSLLVFNIVSKYTSRPEILLQALLHDASEAYLADISSPFKGALTNYRKLEERVWCRIAFKYGLNPIMHPMIKEADWVALFAEALVLQPNSEVHTWARFEDYGDGARRQLAEEGIPNMRPDEARLKMRMLCNALLTAIQNKEIYNG